MMESLKQQSWAFGLRPPIPVATPTEIVEVVSLSTLEEDHISLNEIFHCPEWAGYTQAVWLLHTILKPESAVGLFRDPRTRIVLCERDVKPNGWKGVLAILDTLAAPPLLIVTSRLADESLWSEALNLGAHDVLAKPFDAREVIRVLSLAWLHWKNNLAK
jgi:hypothetical protein